MSLELIEWEMTHDDQPVSHPPPTNAGRMVVRMMLPGEETDRWAVLQTLYAVQVPVRRERLHVLHPKTNLTDMEKHGWVAWVGHGLWEITPEATKAMDNHLGVR